MALERQGHDDGEVKEQIQYQVGLGDNSMREDEAAQIFSTICLSVRNYY